MIKYPEQMTKELTQREVMILTHVAHGDTINTACDKVGIRLGLVADFMNRTKRKLGAVSTFQAIYIATTLGLIKSLDEKQNQLDSTDSRTKKDCRAN